MLKGSKSQQNEPEDFSAGFILRGTVLAQRQRHIRAAKLNLIPHDTQLPPLLISGVS